MNYHLSVETEEGSLYYEKFQQAFPTPYVGEDVLVPGLGRWTVISTRYDLPSMQAMKPGFWVTLEVIWSENNNRKKPVYSDEWGWK